MPLSTFHSPLILSVGQAVITYLTQVSYCGWQIGAVYVSMRVRLPPKPHPYKHIYACEHEYPFKISPSTFTRTLFMCLTLNNCVCRISVCVDMICKT